MNDLTPMRSTTPSDEKRDKKPAIGQANPTVRRSVIVGTMTGGQGKSLVTQVMALAAAEPGVKLRVIAMDSVDMSSGDRNRAKLEMALIKPNGKWPGELSVETLPLEPRDLSVKETYFNPKSINMQFEKLGEALMNDDCLVDLGANVIDRFLDWIATADKGGRFLGAVQIVVVVPVTNEPVSVQRAVGTLQKAKDLRATHKVEVVLVFNELLGPVRSGLPGFADLKKLGGSLRARELTLPLCRAHGFKVANGLEGGLSEMSAMGPDMYRRTMAMNSIFEAAVDLDELATWVMDSMLLVRDVVIPKQ